MEKYWAKLLAHSLAVLFSAAHLTTIPFLLYLAGMVISNDVGGQLNIVIVPLFSLMVGVTTTFMVYLPIAILFSWLVAKTQLPFWAPLLIFLSFSLVFSALWSKLTLEFPSLLG